MTIKARIYKITSPKTDKVYIGSTTKTIEQRLRKHKTNYNSYLNGTMPKNITSYEIIKHGDAIVELLEEKEFKDKKEMFERERFYIESHDNAANKQIPIRTKEELKEQKKQHGIDNYEKQNKKNPCECGGFYTSKHKGQHMKGKQHMNHMKTINITINITCQKVEICKND
jgi:hypothetical protein